MKKLSIIVGLIITTVALSVTLVACGGNNDKNDGANNGGSKDNSVASGDNGETFSEWHETDEILLPEVP